MYIHMYVQMYVHTYTHEYTHKATEYCGRVLMSVEIEDREGMDGAPPSIALTDMKPKVCIPCA